MPVISAHALLAITGLGLWGYYLFSDSTRLAWAAVALLAVVATLGLIMASRWIVVYRTHRAPRLAVATGAHSAPGRLFNPAATDPASAGRAGVSGPPERHFPLPVVIAHGLFATVTIVFVVLTALDGRKLTADPAARPTTGRALPRHGGAHHGGGRDEAPPPSGQAVAQAGSASRDLDQAVVLAGPLAPGRAPVLRRPEPVPTARSAMNESSVSRTGATRTAGTPRGGRPPWLPASR